ncbi:MAG: S24 family peptidase [Oscillospiraceae bacterium]
MLVKGDSMIPDIKSGDIVVVRRQPDIESGQVAVVIINGDEATVKKVIKHKDGIQLVATNPEYMPMFFSNKEIEDLPVSIFGRVMELRRKF